MISIVELIIMMIVVSFCAAAIVGTLVYCILKKKHDEDITWLFNMICDNKTEVSRFYNQYQDHIANYHECYTRYKEVEHEHSMSSS
jgi:hypothetical protein